MPFPLINQIRSRLDENSACYATATSIVADQALPWCLVVLGCIQTSYMKTSKLLPAEIGLFFCLVNKMEVSMAVWHGNDAGFDVSR